jgi:hypothetical protein
MRAFPSRCVDLRLSIPESDAAERIDEFCGGRTRLGKKARKPITTKEPPVPTDSHAEIEDWIRRVMPDLHPVVKRLDSLIRETIPGLQYAVKWKKAYYGLPELGWIIEMVAYDVPRMSSSSAARSRTPDHASPLGGEHEPILPRRIPPQVLGESRVIVWGSVTARRLRSVFGAPGMRRPDSTIFSSTRITSRMRSRRSARSATSSDQRSDECAAVRTNHDLRTASRDRSDSGNGRERGGGGTPETASPRRVRRSP